MDFITANPEEKSVRVFGTGRMFTLEIKNPPFETITKDKLEEIEAETARTKLISVSNLQVINKKAAFAIMESQKLCRVNYQLLCLLLRNGADPCQLADKINRTEQITVHQKSVIRTIEKSDFRTRIKRIFSIRAQPVPGRNNLLIVDVSCEGGLCIEEFVSGDLGRTKPSLKNVLQCPVGLLAVDIMDLISNQTL